MVGEDSMLAGASDLDSETGVYDVDLLRAVYLLQHPSLSSEDTALTLINSVRESRADGGSELQQIRTLRCLFLLTDMPTVCHLSCETDWADHLTSLMYMSQLRKLRVFTTQQSFDAVDKYSVVRALCRCRNDRAAVVAACLAIDYHLSDAQIWTSIIHRLNISNVEVLLRPLPCRSRDVTEAISTRVMSWLNNDVVDLHTAVRICLLLHHCPTYVNPHVLRRCAEEFRRHDLPLCCMAMLQMLPRDDLLDSEVTQCSSTECAVDAELAEFASSGHVLPIARRTLTVLNSNKHA